MKTYKELIEIVDKLGKRSFNNQVAIIIASIIIVISCNVLNIYVKLPISILLFSYIVGVIGIFLLSIVVSKVISDHQLKEYIYSLDGDEKEIVKSLYYCNTSKYYSPTNNSIKLLIYAGIILQTGEYRENLNLRSKDKSISNSKGIVIQRNYREYRYILSDKALKIIDNKKVFN